MKAVDIGIIGTGTAGSATACFLADLGHRVTVYERIEAPKPVGAGIVLQPTGQAVLSLLGLADAVIARGARLDSLWCQTPSGKPVLDLPYSALSDSMFGVGLHRGVLFEALLGAVRARPNITLRLGVDIEDLKRAPRGEWLVERTTKRLFGPHDVIVVADGARSSLRDDTVNKKKVTKYPWGALWALVADQAALHREKRLFQVVESTTRLMGLLPTGLGPEGDTPLLSFFWSIPRERFDAWRHGDFAAWKRDVQRMTPQVEPVLAQLSGPDALLFSEYHDIVMWPWNTERLVYVGDAAHATSPQLGQGANLALLDAYVLGEAFKDAESVPDALYRYSRQRRSHLSWYQFITRWLTPFFQSDLRVLGPPRDWGMSTFGTMGWVQRQMVAGMSGTANWPWLPRLPLPRRA